MIKFKGFDDWVPIFEGGKQIDSSGREHDGEALIDKAVSKFNAARHEPPATIGHPTTSAAPAFGWVEGLKKSAMNGKNLLLAKFKQIEPNFENMVREGRFKKRSAAFSPDGSLHHVAFLGAAAPAVKGLPDMTFNEDADAVFEFTEGNWRWQQLGDILRRLREWFIEKNDQDTADRIIPNWMIEDIGTAPSPEAAEEIPSTLYEEQKEDSMAGLKEKLAALFQELLGKLPDDGASTAGAAATGGTFTEADLASARKTAADEAAKLEREKVTAEFTERERQADLSAHKGEISAWCDRMIAEGKLTPAMVKFGVPQFMETLAEKVDMIQFGEGDGKTEATLFERFKQFFEKELPKVVTFGEVATRDTETLDINNADEIAKKAVEFQEAEAKAGRTISITQAVNHVTKGGKR